MMPFFSPSCEVLWFSTQQNILVSSFQKEPATEVDLREACTMVVESNQETPLPLCIGVMMHANMLKKEIVDRTVLGLSYIRSDKCNCERIQTACSFSLKTGVFNTE